MITFLECTVLRVLRMGFSEEVCYKVDRIGHQFQYMHIRLHILYVCHSDKLQRRICTETKIACHRFLSSSLARTKPCFHLIFWEADYMFDQLLSKVPCILYIPCTLYLIQLTWHDWRFNYKECGCFVAKTFPVSLHLHSKKMFQGMWW